MRIDITTIAASQHCPFSIVQTGVTKVIVSKLMNTHLYVILLGVAVQLFQGTWNVEIHYVLLENKYLKLNIGS